MGSERGKDRSAAHTASNNKISSKASQITTTRQAKNPSKLLPSKQTSRLKSTTLGHPARDFESRTLIKYLDWKESYFYKHWIVRHAEDGHKWENTELMNDDESDFLFKLIRNAKLKKTGVQVEDLLRMCPSMIRKCYNSIEAIYKEVLTDYFWRVEYDQMRIKDPYIHSKPMKGF